MIPFVNLANPLPTTPGTGLTAGQEAALTTATRRQPVASIAALKALTPSAGDAVNVLGYAAAGDGGGGTFYYDAAASKADNGGTVIAPNAGAGRWQRTYSDAVNVQWFGAKGDGVTDDTAAIQAAIDAANEGGGGVVGFPQSTCIVSATLTLFNRVTIDLGGAGVIEMTSNEVSIFDCTGNGATTSRFGIINGRLRYTNAQTTASGSAVLLAKVNESTSAWRLSNLSIIKPFHGIYVPDGANAFMGVINQVTITDPASYATYFGGGASVHTHISISQLWAYCTPGAEPSGSRGHYLANIQALNAESLLADNVQGPPVVFSTCLGNVGTIQLESCERSTSSGGVASMVDISNSEMDIGLVSITANNITLTGATSLGVVTVSSGSRVHVGKLIDNNTGLTIGTGGYYAFYVVDSESVVTNGVAEARGTSPVIATNETSANKPKKICRLDGVNRRLDLEGVIIGTKSSVPSTTDYPEFSIVINSAPALGAPLGWRRIGAAWEPLQQVAAQSASADINTTGFTGNELTNANKINAILSRLRSAGIILP